MKSQATTEADFDLLFRWILIFYAAGDTSRLVSLPMYSMTYDLSHACSA